MLLASLLALACASAATAAPVLARQVPPTYPDDSTPVTNEANTDGSAPLAAPAVEQTGALQGIMGGSGNPVDPADAQAEMESFPVAIKNLQEANDLMDQFIKKAKDTTQSGI